MARHRWATGDRTSSPDRLERVLTRSGVEREPHSEPVWTEAGDGAGYAVADGADGSAGDEGQGAGVHSAERRRSGRRWVATRRAALVAAGCALAVGGWQFVSTDRSPTEVVPIGPSAAQETGTPAGDAPSGEAAAPAEEGQQAGGAGPGAAGTHSGTVVVHVAGAVQAPGVVEAAAGSRVFEVLEKAGGALPEAELSAVNLAAVVQDGQQILIPRVGEPLQRADAAEASDAAGGALVNLNTAGVPDLEELPRVGPVLAERIVEWRSQHGPFTRPEDLDAVPGIGPAMLESLLPLVTV